MAFWYSNYFCTLAKYSEFPKMKQLLLIILLINQSFYSQKYPKNYFRSPLDIPIVLSGTFGELRPNHFHSGIDIKTEGREGLPVYAVGEGYISRIKISTFGYGKAVYITHPNGYTSVYAHLQRLTGRFQEYLKRVQYAQKNYEVEFYPGPDLSVKKGEQIALSGNTGGSAGAHLHFEFRDTKTEKAINPYQFGMDKLVRDNKPPEIINILAYPIGDSSIVNKSRIPTQLSLIQQPDGIYLANKITANGKIGFGVNTHDLSTKSYNRNGIYKLESYLNGQEHYAYDFETFSFEESKHINDFIDFQRYKKYKQRYQKLFNIHNNPLSIISKNRKNDLIEVKEGQNYTYRIDLSDFHGNKTTIIIPISYSKDYVEPIKMEKGKYFVSTEKDYNFEFEKSSVYLQDHAFYEDIEFNAEEKDGYLDIHNNYVAVRNGFVISLDISHLSDEEKKKAFVASIDGYEINYNSSYKIKDKISAKIKSFGKYKVAIDNIPPRIYNPNFSDGGNISNHKTLSISISDALSGIDSYNAYIDDKWILMEYEHKNKRLTHYLSDEKIRKGEYEFKLVVTDKLNNKTVFTSCISY